MPNIVEYKTPVGFAPEPTELAVNTARESASVLNKFERESGSAIGGGIASLGRPTQTMVNDYQDHVDQQQIGHGAAVSTQLWANLMGDLNQSMAQADPNDQSVAQGFREKNLEPALQNFQQQFEGSSERVRNWALGTTDHLRKEFATHVAAQDAIRAQSALDQNVKTEIGYLAKGVNDVPASLPFAIDKLRFDTMNFIDVHATRLGAAGAAKARDQIGKFEGGLVASAFDGMLNRNPEEAQKWYTDPKNADLIAKMDPSHRAVLEHQLKNALLPIEIKREADRIMGPAGTRDIKPDENGVFNLSAPNDASAAALAQEYDVAGMRVRVQVGDATASNPRDTRAMLGQWFDEARKTYPNDPVKRDMLIRQIRGELGAEVAAMEATQKQAQGQLITATIGGPDGKGPKLTSLDDLFRIPGARQQYLKLDPKAAEGINGLLEHNARAANGEFVKSDPVLFNSLRNRIWAPDGSPDKITSVTQLLQYNSTKDGRVQINHNDAERLRKEVAEANTPEGNPFLKTVHGIKTEAQKMLVGSMAKEALAHPEFAHEASYRYGFWLDKQIAAERQAGRDPQNLFVPGSPNYVLDPARVASFMPSEAEIKAKMAAGVKPAAPAAAAGVEFNGYKFPNQAALDKYKAAAGVK